MAAIRRRTMSTLISREAVLATADDVNGTSDNTQAYDVSGALRILIVQENSGTAGTAGIDVVEISKDGGDTWAAAEDVLAVDSNDTTGTVLASGALNAAGVEPTRVALFKAGPYPGKTAIRISRGAAGTGTAWVTGAPKVSMFVIGGSHAGGQLTAIG